jgi:hypothetical protein
MPEQITKYPDVTLQVLTGAGAVCAKGAPQKILTQCPAERFCSLPSGEICVYGVNEVGKMTQIKSEDIAQIAGANAGAARSVGALEIVVLAVVFLIGLLIGWWLKRARAG